MPTAPAQLSDDDLLARYRKGGDAQWLGLLLDRYTTLLLGVCMKYLRDKTEAQDAVQQTFLKAITHLPQGEIQNFKGWLYILARNHCLQLLRDKKYFADEAALSQVPATDELSDALLHNATLDQLHQAIAALNGEQRATITAFYLERKSYAQVCEETGYNFAQVKSFIQNGKRNLKIALSKTLPQTP